MKNKILFFTTSLTYGGTEKVMINYMNYLAKTKRYDLDLIVMFNINFSPVLEKNLEKEINITYLSGIRTGNNFNKLTLSYSQSYFKQVLYALFRMYCNFIYAYKFDRIVKRKKYDTLICFDTGLPNYFTKYKDLKKIIWVHFSIKHLYGRFFKRYRINKWLSNINKYDSIVAISKGIAFQLEDHHINNIIQIYNPIDESILQKSKEEVLLPANVEKGRYITCVARLEEGQKDHTLLINAIAYLRDHYSVNYHVIIVGDGRDRQALNDLIKANNLETQIYLIGNQPNPYPYIANGSLFVLSSKFEGLGVVLLEALFLDKLIISSNCEVGPSEILNNESILVEVGNVEEMALKIYNLLNDSVLQDEICQHLQKQKSEFLASESYRKIESIINK